MFTKVEILKMSSEELKELVRTKNVIKESATQPKGVDYGIEGNWVIDSNNNCANILYWGSEERARASLNTLRDCIGCENCMCCTDCRDCLHCKNCTGCENCGNCMNCEDCTDCIDCKDCTDCSTCTNCMFCWGLTPSMFFIANVEVTSEEFAAKKKELGL